MCRAASGVAPESPTRAAACDLLIPICKVGNVLVGVIVDDLEGGYFTGKGEIRVEAKPFGICQAPVIFWHHLLCNVGVIFLSIFAGVLEGCFISRINSFFHIS